MARQLLEVIARAETGRTEVARDALARAIQYKDTYGPIFEQRARQGLDPPDIYPHPDDVIIDGTEVRVEGPTSKEQAGAQEATRQDLSEATRWYRLAEAEVAKDPTNRTLQGEVKELKKFYESGMKKYGISQARFREDTTARDVAKTPAGP